MKYQSVRPYLPLMALVAVVLFPFGWLAEVWAPFDRFAGALFASEAAHAVGHAAIFALIGSALLLVFPTLRRRPALYAGLVFALALGQEAFQLLYKGRGVVINDLTDIGTDLVAAGVVWALWYLGARGQAAAQGGRYAQTPGRRG